MIKVYHNNAFLSYFQEEKDTLFLGHVQYVASVETDALSEAYQQTNNIDQEWSKNANVKAVFRRNRSTSVGDVLELNKTFHVVEMFGFRELTREEECKLTFLALEATA